jgi:N-acetylmuramoyl-L-alanine amidase
MTRPSASPLKICIDPGHGGADPGAIGQHGLEEAKVVLEVCKKLKAKLEKLKHLVWLTRTNDTALGLKERVDLAKANECDLFLSVHCNSVAEDKVTGIETIFGNLKSADLANSVHLAMIKAFPDHRNRGVKASPSPGYPRKLYVLNYAPCDACLVELEFISNPEMESLLQRDDFQDELADALLKGLINLKRNSLN